MSNTSKQEEVRVRVPDEGGTTGQQKNQNYLISLCMSWKRKYEKRLRSQPKALPGSEDLKHLKKEEATAYKNLMEDLAGEPREHPWPVIRSTICALMLVCFIAVMVTTASVHKMHTKWVLHLKIYGWVGLLMVVVCGLPIIKFVTWLVSEPNLWLYWHLKMDKYGVYFVRELKRSFDVTLWFALVLWVWYTWFREEIVEDTRGAQTLHIPVSEYREDLKVAAKQITRLLMALTIGAFLWMLKTALYLKLKSSLHYKYLCPRIRDAILDLYAIQFITHQGRWSFLSKVTNRSLADSTGNNRSRSSENTGNIQGRSSEHTGNHQSKIRNDDTGNEEDGAGDGDRKMSFWVAVSHLNKETAPIWILKRLTYTYMEHMKNKPAILSDLEATNDDEKFMEKAKKMYNEVVNDPQKGDITSDDLKKYGLEQVELKRVFKLLKTNGDGNQVDQRITKDMFLRWVVLAFKNCLGLESTIASSHKIFNKLNLLLSSCVLVLALVIWLLLSELVDTAQLAILFAPFISASFIFGESLKKTFDGLMFVFGMHPFDVGDRVIIDDIKMKVNEMGLLKTIFFMYESGDEIMYPNSDLAGKSIVNLDVTKNLSDYVEFNVPVDTPEQLIFDLQVKIKKSLDDQLAFTSDTVVAKSQLSDDSITIIVHFKYLVAYHSAEIKTLHRSKIINTIVRLRKDMAKAKMTEEALENKIEEYDAEIVTFQIDTKVKLDKIEEINKKIMDILQNEGSTKEYSKVLFMKIGKSKITLNVHIRYQKTDQLSPALKRTIKQRIVSAINELHGEVIPDKEETTV